MFGSDHGRVALDYVLVYFFVTVLGVTILAGWGAGAADHAGFTHETLSSPTN